MAATATPAIEVIVTYGRSWAHLRPAMHVCDHEWWWIVAGDGVMSDGDKHRLLWLGLERFGCLFTP